MQDTNTSTGSAMSRCESTACSYLYCTGRLHAVFIRRDRQPLLLEQVPSPSPPAPVPSPSPVVFPSPPPPVFPAIGLVSPSPIPSPSERNPTAALVPGRAELGSWTAQQLCTMPSFHLIVLTLG